jgi:hypothetical protein
MSTQESRLGFELCVDCEITAPIDEMWFIRSINHLDWYCDDCAYVKTPLKTNNNLISPIEKQIRVTREGSQLHKRR